MTKPSNPPLFYTVGHDGNVEYDTDITLRDLFAGMAMQGLVREAGPEKKWRPDIVASYAYDVADAMREARGE